MEDSKIGRHGAPLRGLADVPRSSIETGRFGRMFRNLPPAVHRDESLKALAQAMVHDENEETPEGQVDPEETTKPIPAGYTYLGQFIDHDLTFDPASSLDKLNDPNALEDFRTPRFDLDCIYGRGPDDQPYLYDQSAVDSPGVSDHWLLLLGTPVSADPTVAGPDLPRNPQGVALLGDKRNDENLIVSQLQSVMLRFHNRMVARQRQTTGLSGAALFEATQRAVRWHYQWVVAHDFLPRILGQDVIDSVLRRVDRIVPKPGGGSERKTVEIPHLEFYRPKTHAFIPVEFSVAAYRFGHSMVRPIYRFNSKIDRKPIFSGNFAPNNLDNLNGFRPLPPEWGFEWKFFFELGGNPAGQPMQKAYRIDQQLVGPLGKLPPAVAANPSSLAERNLLRGRSMGLPSGQAVAGALGIPPLPDDALRVGQHDEVQRPLTDFGDDFRGNAPLWFYILREAEFYFEGNQLGPVGARIVAEVFIGLLAHDRQSYLHSAPGWTPELADGTGRFDMPQLIRFATNNE
jgi:hypothetical protein